MLRLFVISDATGQTADRVVRAALAQFEQATILARKIGSKRKFLLRYTGLQARSAKFVSQHARRA